MSSHSEKTKVPGPKVVCVSHGGGPLPLPGDASHKEMVESLQTLAQRIPKPEKIIVVSAHWEAQRISLTAGRAPGLLYDYSGFPQEAYQVQYPVPGAPEFSAAVAARLNESGIATVLDPAHGFDHGLFVPLKIMFPQADIPCIQLSLSHHLQADFHIQLGEALSWLDETTLILGSGFTFHNLPAFFNPADKQALAQNMAFEEWLQQVCLDSNLSEEQRRQKLVQWQSAPYARFSHPRAEHLLPLHVCYGAAQRPCREVLSFEVMGKRASHFIW
ncbi:class III extradiol ring-cleavage dioxygenase [Aliiglaciecola sp. CAU 1673]|uniref:DODA-type extradiol aromatic ring-opening family dioxygenase n=1 Tax=Aliiglaciecola sp. CAU 1673 TaxID=3032595 RepID=UPI0023DCE6DF|nr:class III extradiol ring-cleavage dioxygenase [Aliiglaciecola sp. CAU 1673]MDF2179089.1 class III extradiol ring-cleavage dioxygenase [Aliiglaciecola sp. CAU 1673]